MSIHPRVVVKVDLGNGWEERNFPAHYEEAIPPYALEDARYAPRMRLVPDTNELFHFEEVYGECQWYGYRKVP